jgi:PAS domain S-box-containing protein
MFLLIIGVLCLAAALILYQFSRRRGVERTLQESQARFDWLVRHIKDYALFQLDAGGHVMSWNEGARQIKGYTEEEALGQSIAIFYPEEENQRGEPAHNLKMAAEQGRYESIGRRRRKDGSIFWADVVFTAMYDDEGVLTGYIKITRDITEQRRAQQETEQALERERVLNEMKSRFVTLASHEFKTPLSVILSSVSLIERYDGPEMGDKRLRHVHRIKSNVNNLKQLLNDFLSLEKLEEGVVKNNPGPADVVKLVEECVEDIEESCREDQRMSLEVRGGPAEVFVDGHLLRNILNNLLSNAIKYSPGGTPIEVILNFGGDMLFVSIADRGIGIPEEEKAHLFERFFRASNTSGISGTGLGLSIVKRYLDLMGGSIGMEGRPGGGTVFTISIPLRVFGPFPRGSEGNPAAVNGEGVAGDERGRNGA